MPEPMRPEDVPPDLKAIVDRAAGKEHSAAGPVMACLAELLTAHRRMVFVEMFGDPEERRKEPMKPDSREEIQARIEAPVRVTVAMEIRALRTELGLSPDSPEDLAFGRGLEIAACVAEGTHDDGSRS